MSTQINPARVDPRKVADMYRILNTVAETLFVYSSRLTIGLPIDADEPVKLAEQIQELLNLIDEEAGR